MTFDKFSKNLIKFLSDSTVNLGRKDTKTRRIFLETVNNQLEEFASEQNSSKAAPKKKKVKEPDPMSGSVMSIKPSDSRKSLSIGKGVHSMTASESARADEQLGRSPYVVAPDGDE